MCIVVTLNIVSDMLHVPKVAHPNYPSCEGIKTVFKDELMSTFVSVLLIGVIASSLLFWPLLKVLIFLTWL